MHKTAQQRAKAFDHFFGTCRRNARGRTAMERAFKSDDIRAFRRAFFVPVLARHFDRQLAALCSRVGEENRIREGQFNQHIR